MSYVSGWANGSTEMIQTTTNNTSNYCIIRHLWGDEIIAIGFNKATARKQCNNVPRYFITVLLRAPVWQFVPSQPSAQLHVYCPSRSVQRPPCWQGELRHSSISENKAINLSSNFVSGIFRCQSNDKNDPDHNKQHIKLLYNSSFVGRWNYRYWLQ